MRTVHRICALFAMLGLTYIGITGVWMQILDLTAIQTDKPYDDPTMQSINEGYRGEANYVVAKTSDFRAPTFAADFDYPKALDATLASFHTLMPGVAPRFVELRIVNGEPIARVQAGEYIASIDTNTGALRGSIAMKDDRERMPKSVRQTVKQWHRMAVIGNLLGTSLDFLFGIGFLVLLFTGYVMYWRLLQARAKLGKRSLFWSAGGQFRTVHRAVSLVASAFLVMVALSGTWIAFESAYMSVNFVRPSAVPGYSIGRLGVDGDHSAPLDDSEVREMAKTTLAAYRRDEPTGAIRVLRVRAFGAMKQGVIVTGDAEPRQVAYNTATGKPVGLTEPEYPTSGFPLGVAVHEWDKAFHSGMMFGLSGRWINLLAGAALIFLSLSGIVMYLQMWGKRRETGRSSFLWK